MIDRRRITATIEGEFVVFLIGLRINNPLRIDKWLPTLLAMPRMTTELQNTPELGFLGAESWLSRTTIMIQYWRSIDHLLQYSKNTDAAHLPAWRKFNSSVKSYGGVGIWHETYVIKPGNYENVYVNMPEFGLGHVGVRTPAEGVLKNSSGRMRASKSLD